MPEQPRSRQQSARPVPAADELVPTMAMSEEMLGAFEGVVVDVRAKASAISTPAPSAPLSRGWLAAAVVSWAAFAWALLLPPAFSRPEPNRSFEPPAELREPSLRYGLWLADRRVQTFIQRNARAPSHLTEAGVIDPQLRIESKGDRSYELVAHDGAITLRLSNMMAADSFLGSALVSLADSPSYQQAGTPGRTTAR